MVGQQCRPLPDKVIRAEQSLFLAVPEGNQDRPSGRLRKSLEGLHHLDQARDAGGVVVGPVVDEAEGPEAVSLGPVADMVVVGSDHDQFAGKARVAARQEGQHVAEARSEGLVPGAVVAGRLEAEGFDLLNDVGGCRPAAPGAPLAALEGVVSQGLDVAGGISGGDARDRGGQHLGSPAGGGQPGQQSGSGEQMERLGHARGRLLAGRVRDVQNSRHRIPRCHEDSVRSRSLAAPGRFSLFGRGDRGGQQGAGRPVWRGGRVVECASLLKT